MNKLVVAPGKKPFPHRVREEKSREKSVFSVSHIIEMADRQKKIVDMPESARADLLSFLKQPQISKAVGDSGLKVSTLRDLIKDAQTRFAMVPDVWRRSPVLVVRNADDFQAAHVGSSGNSIYVGEGFVQELLKSQVKEDKDLFNAFLLREVVVLAKAKELSGGNNYDGSMDQAEDFAEKFEEVIVGEQLDERLQGSVNRFLRDARPGFGESVRYSLQGILQYILGASHAAPLQDKGEDDLGVHKEFIEKVLMFSIPEQNRAWECYKNFMQLNRPNIDIFYARETMMRLDRFLSNLGAGYYQGDHLTSYPAGELVTLNYLEEFCPEILPKIIGQVKEKVPALTEDISHEELFGILNGAVNGVFLQMTSISDEIGSQVRNELLTRLYRDLLRRVSTEIRTVGLSETTSRDGQQSNIGTNLTGEQQREILDCTFDYGTVDRYETWGGATTQSALLAGKRNGNPPEDPFYNVRAQMALLGRKMVDAFGDESSKLSIADRKLLSGRFRPDVKRSFLTDSQFDEVFTRAGIRKDIKQKVRRIYYTRQEMLLRGQYIVGLMPYPDAVLCKFIETAYRNGVDVFRIFDAFNDPRKIERAVIVAREAGALVQPVLHYTTDFPTGVQGYVDLAKQLIAASADALDSLVIKDAGGLLQADAAYRLVKGLRDAGIAVPIQIHTHDVAGNRQLTLLEAIRANGSEYKIVVDVASGELAAPFAQPNIRHFLNIIKGTAWESGLVKGFNFEKLAQAEDLIKTKILPVLPIAPITTKQRWDVLSGRLPGGMKTNNDADLRKAIMGDAQNKIAGYAKAINAALGITVLDDQNKLTEEGVKFKDAFDVLLYEEMQRVTADMGGISLVTPTSEWIGKQSFNNVMAWIVKGYITLDRSKAEWKLKLGEKLLSLQRQDHYKLSLTMNMHTGLKNYLIERSQDRDVLGRLYPKVNADVVRLAYELEGIRDFSIDEHGFLANDVLSPYDSLRAALDKGVVDRPTMLLMKEIEKIADGPASVMKARAQRAIQTQKFDRAVILAGMDALPKDVNIAKSWEEYQDLRDRQRAAYPEINETDEDLLLFALFPQKTQFFNLVTFRDKVRKEGLHMAMGPQQLRALGFDEATLRTLGNGDETDGVQQQDLFV